MNRRESQQENNRCLIFSQNTLFGEILAKALEKKQSLEIINAPVLYASLLIQKNLPKAIFIDQTLPPVHLGEIIQAALNTPDCKVVFLNPYQNDTIILAPKRKSMRKAEDLMYILNDEIDPNPETPEDIYTVKPDEIAQARADMFGLLAAFLNHRPDSEFLNRLRAVGIHQFLDTIVEQNPPSKIQTGLKELGAFLEDTLQEDESKLTDQLGVDWTLLFRGLRPGYGPKPPYGYLYQTMKLSEMAYLQKISSTYTSFGAEIEPSLSNRPDYLGLQLAFISFLYQQASNAYQQGNSAEATRLEMAAADFFTQELAPWAPIFCQEAQAHCKTRFYHGYLDILVGQIQELNAE